MVMKALRDGASGGITKFILMGFLALAVGGLVMMDIGGFFRGGITSTDAAKIGKETIPIAVFDRSVRRTLSRIGISPQDAHRAGYINQILGSELRGRLLSQLAEDTGILVDRDQVIQKIQDLIEPLAGPGQSTGEVLGQILLNQGMSEAEFIRTMRQDIGSSLLTNAMKNGFISLSPGVADDIYRHQKEKRTVQYIVFKHSEMTDIPTPTDEQIQTFYNSMRDNYAIPETRIIKLVTINDEALKKTLDISEEELRQTYDDNIDLYTINDRRTLEQALLPTEEQAQTVLNSYNNSKDLKKAVEEATEQSSAYLGEQDFEEDSLFEGIKEPVLEAKQPGTVLGPLNSPLGWHVVVVKKISPKKVKTFEEVKAEIKDEIMSNLLIDQQYELANLVDDMFAGGASLEEVAGEVELDIKTFSAMTTFGQDEDGRDVIKDAIEDRGTFLQTAFELLEGETSAVLETAEGRFSAIHVDTINPKTYRPFAEVKNTILERWLNDQRRASNMLRARNYIENMDENGITVKQLAQAENKTVQTQKDISRTSEPKEPLNIRSVANIFETPLGKPFVINIKDGVAVAEVIDFSWAKNINPESEDYKKLQASLITNMQNESFALYLENKKDDYRIKVNNGLIDRVYGPGSETY